jgi:LuxR family maltose regulon positive regulatory protein
LISGDLHGARRDIEQAVENQERLCFAFGVLIGRAALAWVLALEGKFDRARTLIRETLARTQAAGTASIEFELRVAAAYTELAAGEREAAQEALRAAFALGRQQRYVVTGPVWLPEAMSRLCAEALAVGIEPDYVQELIRRRGLAAPSPEVEHWPWPVRLYTLGRFSVVRAGAPVRFRGKSPGKPMRLLQALLALGGREVAVDTLLEALWAHAEGDAAENAFNVTLLRLHRLLGEAALLLSERKLSLNDRYCWVDAWALERLAAHFDAAITAAGARSVELAALAEQALALYRGLFLARKEHAGWAAPARVRLRSRFVRMLGGSARAFREHGTLEEAITLCRRVLEIEPTAEDLLAELLRALMASGRPAQAADALREAESVFLQLLGRPPSPALRRLIM